MVNVKVLLVLGLNILAVFGNVSLKPGGGVEVDILDLEQGFGLITNRGGDYRYVGTIGNNKQKTYKLTTNGRTLAILDFGDGVELKINVIVSSDNWQIHVRWLGPKDVRHEDCISFEKNQWFGGPELMQQFWPVQKLNLTEYSYVSKEERSSAILEPYWVNSEGTIVYVYPQVPLFVDQNNIKTNHLCLIAQIKDPYAINRVRSDLSYDLVFTKNARVGHEYAVARYLGKPVGYPDFRMIQHPIWSTWARYKRDINESTLLEFAKEIVAHGFKNSQFEIDDFWETCYGNLILQEEKFPNFKQVIQTIKSMGFRVTLWIHPFININCEMFTVAEANGYLVKGDDGSVLTKWWNSDGLTAGYVDFTNPEAASWWVKRLIDLQTMYGIDSFKFDAGESSWSPQIPVQPGDTEIHPAHITIDFVRAVADFGSMIEIRAGRRTQDLPVFVRMLDKDTRWTFENGLPTLVTTLLQMNMNGYTLVLPDMIGGNGYNEKPSKELFIRWLQANTFMPSLQYSYVPWDFDEETIIISRTYSDLHAKYAGKIEEAMARCVRHGSPVNAPIWWIDPTDEQALTIWDEFLLGESILVAPVLEEGAIIRDIYLPEGMWKYQGIGDMISGKTWLRNFPAPLDTLPYFIKIDKM